MSFSEKIDRLSKMYQQGLLSKTEFLKAKQHLNSPDTLPELESISTTSAQDQKMEEEWMKKNGSNFQDSRYGLVKKPTLNFVFYHTLALGVCFGLWSALYWVATITGFWTIGIYLPILVAAIVAISFVMSFESYKKSKTYFNGHQRYDS